MRFGILGETEVWAGPDRIPVGGARVRAVLALLLLAPGRLVPAEHIIDGVYGDAPPTGAGNAVQSQIARLRRMLGDDGLIRSRPGGYVLEAGPDDVDAHRFERLAAEGRRMLAAGDHRGAAGLLREALGLWRGPALADVGPAPFAAARIARLSELRLAATEDRIEADLAVGEHRGLVPELEELVAAHPVRERLRAQLMRALAASGRQTEALETYADMRRVLADELGADPSAELAAAHLAVLRGQTGLGEHSGLGEHPGLRAEAGGERPARPSGGAGVPVPLTGIVGRDDEVERVTGLIARHRLVTLTGPGGVGKTRLATEVAGRQPGETYFAELAAHPDVLPALLDTLGLRDGGLGAPATGPDPLERLVAVLAGRPVLLVLDNCEHVVDETARVAQRLLARCPGLRVLATSREVLAVTGEAVVPVQPLPLDAAVRLFTERATAARSSFAADPAALERICELLDRLPLAVELAAARLRTLPLADIEARLDDRFALLSQGSRTAQRHHRTLRDVVEWSWNLLDPAEQAAARRLAVFAGGATTAAAERVCGAGAAEALSSLVDKSLVDFDGERYRMLATIRAFCWDGSPEARRAHLDYFLALAEAAEPWSRRAEQVEWLAALTAEHANLNAALRWAAESGDLTAGLRLVAALAPYWMLGGRGGEAGRAAAEVLGGIAEHDHAERVPAGLEEEYVLCVLIAAAVGLAPPAHVARARALMEGRAPAESRAVRPFLTFLWGSFSGIADGPADLRAATDPWTRSLLHYGLGLRSWWVESDQAEAEREFGLALGGFRALGERWGMATTLSDLALLADARGDTAACAAMAEEALGLFGALGSTEDMARLLCRRGDARRARGLLADATGDYERAAGLAGRAGAPGMVAMARHGLAEAARERGDLPLARRLCRDALAACPAGWVTGEETRARIHLTLGEIARAEGDAGEARTWLRRALGSQNLETRTAATAALESLPDPVVSPGPAATARPSTG
ncbi:BTAD domain-containing putative transcriptional regulator [Microbispora sp. CA-135349]|uniref:BTAD domain-containing putative transcriptional regulator n=1 Tax=Microbispora sp. CA-135349 TaxID=3239953 RepID=UPI003D90C443